MSRPVPARSLEQAAFVAHLPVGAVVTVTGPRKQVVYTKHANDQWTSNVFTGLEFAADAAVGWWLMHRSHKTVITNA